MIDWIGALCTWLAGVVLVASGALKIGTTAAFRQSLTQFQLPRWTWNDNRFAQAFPWLELLLGGGAILLPGPWQEIAAAGITVMFVAFLVLVIRANRRPVPVSCNCFGGLGDDTVGTRTIMRNAVLVALAVAAVVLHRSPATVVADRLAGWTYPLPAVLAILIAAALVVWRAVARRRREARIVRTLTVQDVDGNELPITEFQDPPTFLVFFSPGCGGCRSVVEHFRWWPNLLKDGFDLQPVFLGTPEQFRQQEEFAPLVEYAWYADRTVSRAVGIPFTPGAVLIDPVHPLGQQATGGRLAIQDFVLRDDWRHEVEVMSATNETAE